MTIRVSKNVQTNIIPTVDDAVKSSVLTLDKGGVGTLSMSENGAASIEKDLSDINTTSSSGGSGNGLTSTTSSTLPSTASKSLSSESEVITISSPGTVSDNLLARGIDQNQPEILSAIQFVPLKENAGKSACGELLDMQFSLRSLKTDDSA